MTTEQGKTLKTIRTYRISEVAPYINWFYFFHAWGMPAHMVSLTRIHDCEGCTAAWIKSLPREDQDKGKGICGGYRKRSCRALCKETGVSRIYLRTRYRMAEGI